MRSRLSSFQTGKTAPLGYVETASLQGILWNNLLLQASEKKCGCLEELERDRCSSSGSSAGEYKRRLCLHFFA
ncbi:hypothetical protein AMECASPLE_033613 [Ameca splendens]|uniref:Uncharacterized protein n=1 Tax=Ameca splendens TaxID=208324 RepID=A0ABV1A2A2_9TELE